LAERGSDDCAVGLVELFSGIGGGRRSLELLGVTPAIYVASEVVAPAKRVVRLQWPEVVEWGDVAKVSEAEVANVYKLAPAVRLWLVVGGFPCKVA